VVASETLSVVPRTDRSGMFAKHCRPTVYICARGGQGEKQRQGMEVTGQGDEETSTDEQLRLTLTSNISFKRRMHTSRPPRLVRSTYCLPG
jgi:hypothetical protein